MKVQNTQACESIKQPINPLNKVPGAPHRCQVSGVLHSATGPTHPTLRRLHPSCARAPEASLLDARQPMHSSVVLLHRLPHCCHTGREHGCPPCIDTCLPEGQRSRWWGHQRRLRRHRTPLLLLLLIHCRRNRGIHPVRWSRRRSPEHGHRDWRRGRGETVLAATHRPPHGRVSGHHTHSTTCKTRGSTAMVIKAE